MNELDVAVVGGGAAGLSAALVLTRARRRVAVVDEGRPRNAPAAQMHGYLSRDGLSPQELLAIGRREVAGYGGMLIAGRVARVERAETGEFRVALDDGRTLAARHVVIATGLRDETPDVPGVRERWGRDLLHCPYCHGHEVRDQPLGVLGGTADTAQHAHLIRQWSDDVVFFPHTEHLPADQRERLLARGIDVVDGPVRQLVIDGDRLAGVELTDGRFVSRTAVFVRPRFRPHAELLVSLGCATDEPGWVRTDAAGRTTVPGVWAAGNAVNARAQVITAAGEGSALAIALNGDLVAEDVASATAPTRHRPTLERVR